jgi:hypothetical protein
MKALRPSESLAKRESKLYPLPVIAPVLSLRTAIVGSGRADFDNSKQPQDDLEPAKFVTKPKGQTL